MVVEPFFHYDRMGTRISLTKVLYTPLGLYLNSECYEFQGWG